MSISVPPKGDADKRAGAYFAPLRVSAQDAPNMTVRVNPGSYWTAMGEHVEYVGGNSPIITAPTSDAKWVVVAVNDGGTIELVQGASGTSPQLPSLPRNVLPIAAVFVGDTTTMITNDAVFDIRPMWQIRAENVPNLQQELDDRPTLTDISALLADKADIDGTPASSFVLNKDHVGIAGDDVELVVNRGANPTVSIRWNETAEEWQFSNDGFTWDPIGVASGVYYTKVDLDGGALDARYYTIVQLDDGQLDSRYYTESEVDTLFAPVVHSHAAGDITGLAAAVAAAAPVQDVAGKTGSVVLVEADITDLDKYDTVGGAVVGNLVSFGAGALADSGIVAANVSLTGHTHVAADVTDFAAAADARIALAGIDDLADVVSTGELDKHVLVYNGTSGWYNNRLLALTDLADVTTTAGVLRHVLIHDGVNYTNRLLTKADVSDFVEGDFVHTYAGVGSPVPSETIYGEKIFADDVTVQGSIVVQGASASIETPELYVTDKFIDINYGETGAGVGGVTPQDGGIRVKRGSLPDALLYWEESSDQWMAGTVGDANYIVLGNHTHNVSDIVDFAAGVTTQLGNNKLNTMMDVDYPAVPVLNNYLRYDGTNWIPAIPVSTDISDFAARVTLELNANSIDEMADVAVTLPADRHALMYTAGSPSGWVNRLIEKADVSDFVETDYVHTFGDETILGNKTFSNNIVVSGDLTVNGTTTTVNSTTLTVADNLIVVNDGEPGAGVTGGTAGLEVHRGSLTNVMFYWDEPTDKWNMQFSLTPGGTIITRAVSWEGHLHVLTDVTDVSVTYQEVNQLDGVSLVETVQQQLDQSLRRDTNEAMDPTFNLSFSAGGEVLGLPAVPTVDDAAASKKYVDDQVGSYDELSELLDVTITSPAAGEFLAVQVGSPTNWVNRLIVENDISDLGTNILLVSDIGGGSPLSANPVQAWDADLDTIASLAHTGDEMIYSNAGTWATTASTAFSRSLLDDPDALTARATLGVVIGTDVQAWDANLDTIAAIAPTVGDMLVASGSPADWTVVATTAFGRSLLAETDAASTRTTLDLYSATELDGTAGSAGAKIDKVAGAVAGNLAELDAAGELVDSGVASANVLTFSTTGEISHTLTDLADVTVTTPQVGHLLQYNGGQWVNLSPSAITQFVTTLSGGGAQTVQTNMTFSQDVTITGDLTVNGTTTTVNSTQVDIGDAVIQLNALLSPSSPPTVDAGIEVNRGNASDNAQVIFDETNDYWTIGTVSDMLKVARETETVAQPYYAAFVASGSPVNTTYATTFTVPTPAAGKTAEQVFVNGIKQRPGATKQYTVSSYAPLTVVFNAGAEPPLGADVEVYGFGTIG